LTLQQHTVWIDVYCDVYAAIGGYNASVGQTLTFIIDSQAQSIAFHEDPVATTKPGTRPIVTSGIPFLILNPSVTPTVTPFPTTAVPELPAVLAITFLVMVAVALAAVVKKKNNYEVK
jgi:hypothetical protein